MDGRNVVMTARWCCSDLRDGDPEKLEQLLKEGCPFTVDIGVAKEIHYASISRDNWNDEVNVWVTVETDEYDANGDYALITDALYAIEKEDVELSEEELEAISDELWWYGIQTEYADGKSLPGDCSLGDVMDVLDQFEKELEQAADDGFERVKNIVKDYLDKKEENEND